MLHRADESQPARNSCPRLPHSVDSRFGLYHVAVVLSFLRSPALQKFESFFKVHLLYVSVPLLSHLRFPALTGEKDLLRIKHIENQITPTFNPCFSSVI